MFVVVAASAVNRKNSGVIYIKSISKQVLIERPASLHGVHKILKSIYREPYKIWRTRLTFNN